MTIIIRCKAGALYALISFIQPIRHESGHLNKYYRCQEEQTYRAECPRIPATSRVISFNPAMPFRDLSELKGPRDLYPLTRKPNQPLHKQLLMIARAPMSTRAMVRIETWNKSVALWQQPFPKITLSLLEQNHITM